MGASEVLDVVSHAWSWIGLDAVEIIAANHFGNLIVRAKDGAYWRICPEELSCKRIARDSIEFTVLEASEEFRTDWEMTRLVELAQNHLGSLEEGRCYCLKLPGVFGGKYEESNLGTNTLKELVSFAGDLAQQINDLPDGAYVKFKIVP